MAIVNNPWTSYITRSYSQIKASLVAQMLVNNPEVTDNSESNVLIMIIDMFAGISEMLGYYIDNMAREAFIQTARLYPSMVKLVKILDYRIKAIYPSSADVIFTFNTATTGGGGIPIGTILQTSNNTLFQTVASLSLPIGSTTGTIGVTQIVPVLAANLGTTNGAMNQALLIGLNYVDNSINILTINSVIWNLVDTLGLSGPTDNSYIVEIDVDGNAYVVFGDGTNGAIPPTGYGVTANYNTSNGSLGNVNTNAITSIVSTITLPGVTSITVTNPEPSSGGSDYEDIDSIRRRAPLSIRTLMRAVTAQDYIDIVLLYTGVGKATLDFTCGKNVPLYIVPTGGGIAASPLLMGAVGWMNNYRMVTTFVQVYAAGQTPLTIAMTVTLNYRADPVGSLTLIQNTLVNWGSYANQDINKQVNFSNLVSIINDLPCTYRLTLTQLSTQPYAMPVPGSIQPQLYWTRATNTTCNTESQWQLTYNGGISFSLLKNGLFNGNPNIGIPYTDTTTGDVTFTINPGLYPIGQEWTFTSYPVNSDINIDDFTIPIVNLSDISITLITQLVPPII